MQKFFTQKGVTLTELIIASVLVGIIMLGVTAFNLSLSQMERASSKSTVLAMRSLTLLNHIRQNVKLGRGDQNSQGVYSGSTQYSGDSATYLAIRQDQNTSPQDPTTAAAYTNDTWVIYFWVNGGSNLYRLYVCTQTPASYPSPATTPPANANCSQTPEMLADNVTNFSVNFSPLNSNYQPDGNGGWNIYFQGQFSVQITLQTKYTPTDTYDPFTNPMYTATTSVSPSAHSY